MSEILVKSSKKNEFIDITFDVQNYLSEKGCMNGMLFLNILHTTAALTINENADPDVKTDMLHALDKMIPDIHFKNAEGNSDAHIKSSLFGTSLVIPVSNGRIIRGIWQGIYFCEFNGPKENRKVHMNFIGE